ncbi:hypothetical protein ACSCB1_35450 [Streptomyces europaeiscabiei]|uniref:hypothetical protein n=1 Tax=Streptomyces europaeiscabiei TaxID=146819 RepID=UPI000B1B57EF|nr:hypothetical protein [Streptomyces europaeiscabiei]
MKFTNSRKIVVGINLAICTAIIAMLAYAVIAPYKVAEYVPGTFSITNLSDIKAGGSIAYQFRFCRYVDESVTASSTRLLVPLKRDGTLDKLHTPIVLTVTPISTAKRGCFDGAKVVAIPDETRAGMYRMEIVTEYRLLPFRSKSVIMNSQPFFVATN